MRICGHEKVRERLGRMAVLPVAPQSFLFSGPRRLGKFSVALEFAQRLSGSTDAGMPIAGSDILVIGRAEAAKTDESTTLAALSVESIRDAEAFLSRFPQVGKYRVVIIDGADRLTISAENSLLKLLEEPNSTSIIILITHLPGKLLPTVRSRLFTVNFAPLSASELRGFFPAAELPDFFFSLGLPGLVSEAAADMGSFDTKKKLLRRLFQLSRLTWSERLSLAEELAREPETITDLLEIWIAGLERQQSDQALRSVAFAAFLEEVLETLDRVARREGNPRLLLEKLFTKA